MRPRAGWPIAIVVAGDGTHDIVSTNDPDPGRCATMATTNPSDAAAVEARIRGFLEEQLLIDFGDGIDPDSDLFRLGLMDSYAYIEAMRFIESAFGIEISDEDMLMGVEVSLRGLTEFARTKL